MTTKPRTRRTRTPASSQDGKAAARVIRKYPNRRLYDTVESRYVTLADIRRLVVERIDFVVLVGGSALDFEIPQLVTKALADYRVVAGRANIRGTEGPRNAVATGLAQGGANRLLFEGVEPEIDVFFLTHA